MSNWKKRLIYDPANKLAGAEDTAIRLSFHSEVIRKNVSFDQLWQSKPAQAILKKQQSDGSWKYPSKQSATWTKVNYDQYETFKQLSVLVEKYHFTKDHPSIAKVADYFFQFLAPEGDIRGIYGNQTSPNYTAAILELLIKAGYESDKRIAESIQGLLELRQDDGGWALAFRTQGGNLGAFDLEETIEPDKSKPSSAMVTGVVLRALSVHPEYRDRPETKVAAQIVAESIFTPDKYADRKTVEYWTRFGFPFVYTDIVSALDSLSRIGGFNDHPKVVEALEWLESRRTEDGLFDLRTTRGSKQAQKLWMSLAICKIYKRLFTH